MATLTGRVVDLLREWPALELCNADCGAGTGLAHGTRQIMHLHRPDEAELNLTSPVINRMAPELLDTGRVTFQPGSDWVRIELTSDSDAALLISLISVAIQATGHSPAWNAPCSYALDTTRGE